jgi:hypothetical protein
MRLVGFHLDHASRTSEQRAKAERVATVHGVTSNGFDLTGELRVVNSYRTRRSALALDEVRHYLEYDVLSLDLPNDDELAAAAGMI